VEHQLGDAVARVSKGHILEHPGACSLGFFESDVRFLELEAIKGIRRTKGVAQTRKAPRHGAQLIRALAAMRTDLFGLRDRPYPLAH
jgi:hypothetical protein